MIRMTPATRTACVIAALTLASLGGCGGGGMGSALVTSDSVAFSAPDYGVLQSGASVMLTVTRGGDSAAAAISVAYATADGTALAGTDYTAATGTLQWAAGDASSKNLAITIANTAAYSGSKTFAVTLTDPSGGAVLAAPSSATVTISGSDGASAGSVAWVYYNGTFNWGGDYSFNASIDYADRSGAPLSGAFDIAVTINGAYGAFQPYAGGTVPLWNFVDTGYTYLTFAIKPTIANQSAQIYFTQVGDIPVGIDIDPFSGPYGPPPQAGVWSTYKIPLTDLGVANTSVYKFAIQDQTGLSNNLFYLDNIGFE